MIPSLGECRPAAVVGVDVGGTWIKGAVQHPDGRLAVCLDSPTPVGRGAEAVIAAVADMVADLRSSCHTHDISHVGVAVPGLVDRASGIVRLAANIGWRDLPVSRVLGDRVGLPVTIDHDARAAGLAEMRFGAARDVSDAMYVSIGTGVSAAIIASGRVMGGGHGMAGEIGHIPIVCNGEPCACGQRGCAESYASTAAIMRRYVQAGGRAPADAEEVIQSAAGGDDLARKVFAEAVSALATVLGDCVLIMDPSLIVIGGGAARAGESLLDPLRKAVQSRLLWRSPPKIVTSAVSEGAGRVGAALIAWEAVRAA